MPEPLEPPFADLAQRILGEPGVRAIWLAGSHSRGEAHPLSDIDVGVIAASDLPFRVDISRVETQLVTVTWTTANATRASFDDPAMCGTAVSGWRDARVLHDPHGIGADLVRTATNWTWEGRAGACDTWVVARITEYAEAAQKLIGALRAGHHVAAAAQRSFLALRLPIVMSVHARLLYPNWRTLWRRLEAALGDEWSAAHRSALAVDARGATADRSALALFDQAANRIHSLMGPTECAVVDPVRALIGAEYRQV